jgi:hypothetical protein
MPWESTRIYDPGKVLPQASKAIHFSKIRS